MMEGREPDEATDDPWHCAGCNAPAKGKKKPCDCVTNVGVRTGPNGYREQTWWDDPPAADARWVAIDEKGNDNFATSIYENDYDGLLVARCNQNGNHPWQAAAILRGLERNRQAAPPVSSDLAGVWGGPPNPSVESDRAGVWTDEIWFEHVRKVVAQLRSPASNATGLRVSSDHYLWLADKVLPQSKPLAASDLRERAQKVVSDFCGYMAGDEWHPLIDDIAAEFAAIRAEAKAEGRAEERDDWMSCARVDVLMEGPKLKGWNAGLLTRLWHERLSANRPTGRED